MTVGQSCSMACTSSCRYTRWGFLWMGWAWPSFFFLIGPSLYLEWSIPILTSFSMVCLGMLNGASLSWMVHVLMCMIWGGVWRVKSEGWIWRGRVRGGSGGAESLWSILCDILLWIIHSSSLLSLLLPSLLLVEQGAQWHHSLYCLLRKRNYWVYWSENGFRWLDKWRTGRCIFLVQATNNTKCAVCCEQRVCECCLGMP